MSASETISPTAHYTGYVWGRNGLSHRELVTREGWLLFESLRPTMTVSQLLGGATLEAYLLARHRAIDLLLERAIEQHGVTQVVEVAAGLSPRGWRFTQRYGGRLRYVETDLAGMVARKRKALERMGSLGEHHLVRELDALRDDGPRSLAALAGELDHDAGLAIITEGLLGYLPRDAVGAMWGRFATVLGQFATGRYISDLHIGAVQTVQVRAFRVLLSAFVRGRVHLHFEDSRAAQAALLGAGFAGAEVRGATEVTGEDRRRGRELAHVVEAWTQ